MYCKICGEELVEVKSTIETKVTYDKRNGQKNVERTSEIQCPTGLCGHDRILEDGAEYYIACEWDHTLLSYFRNKIQCKKCKEWGSTGYSGM